MPSTIYAKPADAVIATAEEALCDFVWLNLREGVEPRHLVTFLNLDRLNRRRLRKILPRYPERVKSTVEKITAAAS